MNIADIMIVEDQRIVAEDLKIGMEAMGHRVVFTAAHGETAVEGFGRCRPDLVLMDIYLAGSMDGIEAARRIHEKALEKPALIFLSAHSDDRLVERAKTVEPCSYLVKPASLDQLRVAVELGLHASRKEAEKRPERRAMGRVLVMDDEEMVRGVLEAALERDGYETTLTVEGAEAVERYRDAMGAGEPFDVVIVDLEIADGMGGKEAVRKLREIDPAVRAIAHSGSLNDPAMTHCQTYGFAAALPKPSSLRELRGIMARMIPSPESKPAP